MSEPVVAIAPPSDDEFDWNVRRAWPATSVPAIAPPWPKLRPFVNEGASAHRHAAEEAAVAESGVAVVERRRPHVDLVGAHDAAERAARAVVHEVRGGDRNVAERVDRAGAARCEFRSNREPWIVTSLPALISPGMKRDELSVNVEFHTTTSRALIAL